MASMSVGQAVRALDDFLRWLNVVPVSWYGKRLAGSTREAATRPHLSNVAGDERIAWPADNLYNAQEAWSVLLNAATFLDEFPFNVYGTTEGTSQTVEPVNAKTITLVRSFLAKAADTLGYEIPESTGVKKSTPAWQIALGVVGVLALVGGLYYAYTKIGTPSRPEPLQLPPLRRQRRPQYVY